MHGRNRLDKLTILIYLLLVFMGWLNIYAATYTEAHSSIFDLSQRYGKQLIWIGMAFVLAVVILLTDSKVYSVFAYIIFVLMLLVLLSTLFFGTEVNGAKSWLKWGAFGFQPAEFVKFATALALAKLISPFDFKLNRFSSYLKVGAILLLPVLIILLQNDVGSALVFASFILPLYREGLPGWILAFLFFLVALFIATLIFSLPIIIVALFVIGIILFIVVTKRIKQAIRLIVLAVSIGLLMYLFVTFFDYNISINYFFVVPVLVSAVVAAVYSLISRVKPAWQIAAFVTVSVFLSFSTDFVFYNVLETHHQKRINDLLGIESDPLGWGYNVNQSKIAIGSGGLLGKGFLEGTQTKYNFVPEQSTDFIFCTVGEEWGFVGSFVVLFLFGALLLRLIKLAERQREAFARIYGYSVVAIIFFHVAVNIGMTVGLFPVIGIPLPFFSYGGSSIWAFTILLFIFLKLDRERFAH